MHRKRGREVEKERKRKLRMNELKKAECMNLEKEMIIGLSRKVFYLIENQNH